MAFLQDKDVQFLKDKFAKEMVNDVTVRFFTKSPVLANDCQYCDHTKQLLEELAATSEKIKLVVHTYPTEKEMVEKYGIDKIPAIVFEANEDVGIRFYGIPSGYEFSTVIETIIDLSRGKPELPDNVLAELSKVTSPVTIKVFVTPT
ncbi:thioredoxin family protein [Carboxydothermus pertinax]|uniref:Thioredoxin-like fold domain-containing protein n=1 Tax=Carboxydothermus pertinax TaxID=870242 RepID=A0A1L8CSR2_9THEO|nr:thioredoxin family protein [Carboxydothermus pertinax]GAV21975.1 hypothetical protein cpu_04850 [Carboxydothermus pertinax]